MGYAVQGSLKYGLFEAIKPELLEHIDRFVETERGAICARLKMLNSRRKPYKMHERLPELTAFCFWNTTGCLSCRLPSLLLAGVLAELVASTALCPLEAARIRSVQQRGGGVISGSSEVRVQLPHTYLFFLS